MSISRLIPVSAPAYAGGGTTSLSNYNGMGASLPQDIGNIFSGLFSDSGAPYKAAQNALSQGLPQAQQYLTPYFNAGTGAMGKYQDFLSSMQNPSGFINNLMKNYQQSPFAQYEQQQAIRAAQNAGSASGLTGSSPLSLQMSQNAANISSQDMQNWLQNVLGVNQQYGAGQLGLTEMGQGAGNSLSDLMTQLMSARAGLDFGQEYAKQQQQGSLFSGLANLFL